MDKAWLRFGQMRNIWESSVLPESVKLQLYRSGVVSVLTYGSEVWRLTDATIRSLRGWNAKYLARITGRSIREECVEPTWELIVEVRKRRLKWPGHILRSPDTQLLRQVVVAQSEAWCNSACPPGSIFMDAPAHTSMAELISIANDRQEWRVCANALTPANSNRSKQKHTGTTDVKAAKGYKDKMSKDLLFYG